jgi:hypothetical protein
MAGRTEEEAAALAAVGARRAQRFADVRASLIAVVTGVAPSSAEASAPG